jgi:tryptophanyl-tRNA synthetase
MGETFVIPEAKIQYANSVQMAEKMSKSANNIINIFLDDKALRKQVMGIETDSTPLEDPKNPETCNAFAIYKLLATEEQLATMTTNYLGGNYGYGHAKQALFELICETFKTEEKYNYYLNNLEEVDALLKIGAGKAAKVANGVLSR